MLNELHRMFVLRDGYTRFYYSSIFSGIDHVIAVDVQRKISSTGTININPINIY